MRKQATSLIHGNVNQPTMCTTALHVDSYSENKTQATAHGEKGKWLDTAARNTKWYSRDPAENGLFLIIQNKHLPQGLIIFSPTLRRKKSPKASVYRKTCLWMFIVVYFMTVQGGNIPLILQTANSAIHLHFLAQQEKETAKGSPNMRNSQMLRVK